MAFRRRFRGRRGGRRMPVRWTGDFNDAVVATATGALGFLTLLAPADYRQQATMEESGVTAVRIRGVLSVYGSTAGGLFHFGVFHGDQAITPTFNGIMDPGLFASYIDGGLMFHTEGVAPTSAQPLYVPFDIKTRRKLEDDAIFAVLRATGATMNWVVSGRTLVRGG